MYHFVQYLYHFIFLLLYMTLVVPCLDNIFMVLLISALATIGATKLFFFGFWFPQGGGGFVRAWAWFVIIALFIYQIQVKTLFSLSLTVICAELCCQTNYLRTFSSALCQIRALEKAFKKQNNGQSVPKIMVLNACIRS